MKKLYAPWRSYYAQRVHQASDDDQSCTFCRIIASSDDAAEFIISRGTQCVTMLNKYPYNAGHLLVVPYGHHTELYEYDNAVHAELMAQVSNATKILQESLGAQGCNVGINLGKAAGAGIPEHLHLHVLPRFFGDTNFLPTLADTKQISFDLQEIYGTLKEAFTKIGERC